MRDERKDIHRQEIHHDRITKMESDLDERVFSNHYHLEAIQPEIRNLIFIIHLNCLVQRLEHPLIAQILYPFLDFDKP